MMGRGVQYPACMMGRGVLCLTVFSLLSGIYAQPLCTLILPSLLRVESEETIVLDAQSVNVPFVAEIIIQDFPLKSLHLASAKVSLDSSNGFLGKFDIKIPGKDLQQDAKKKQYVSVSVRSMICSPEKTVMLSFHSGYIFVQTDKTIYNPGTKVLYRLFITGPHLEPDRRSVDVEFINPDKIVVMKDRFSSGDNSGIIPKVFNLPEITNDGIWQIACKFQVAPQEIYRTEFEVKEYVLPSFEVLLDCPQNSYFVDDNEFTVDITAKFLHGKEVEGSGYAIFGIIINNEKKSFPDSLTNITVTQGSAKATLQRYMITSHYPDPTLLLGSSLYVTVVVLTNAGSDMVEAQKTDIPVVKTAFEVLFPKSSEYFKPGLPYMAKLLLQTPNGLPAPRIQVCTVDGNCAITSADGAAQLNINTDSNIQELQVQVRTNAVGVPEHRQTTGSLKVKAYRPQGESGNFLHIGIQSTQVKISDTISVQFYVKNKNANVQKSIRHITYMILSKGRVIEMDRQAREPEQAFIVVSLVVTEKYIPSFRILAYYVVPSTGEIVADSVLVETVDSCMRKLELTEDPNNIVLDPEPGSSLALKITGEPGAYVGLVAVDKAVFVLNKKNRMSQDKIWKEVKRGDLGCTSGGGVDNAGVFTDAGLSVTSSMGLNNRGREDLHCEKPLRKKRSLILNEAKARKALQYQHDARLRRCCEDGMLENPMGYTCQKRAGYVLDAGECARVFLECCKFIFEPQVIRGRPKFVRRPNTIFHHSSTIVGAGTSESGSLDGDYESMDFASRSIFSESWLWRVEMLPMKADRNGDSSKTVYTNFPESITTWEFLAISISANSGICVAKPYEMLVKKPFFIDLRLPYSVVRNEQVEIRAVLYSYVDREIQVRVDLIFNKKMCSASTAEANFRQEVIIGPLGTLVLPFVVVPLETGSLQIEVKASVKDYFITDGVLKNLKVVPEGMRILKNIQSIILDPQRSEVHGVQELTVDLVSPQDIVPNTDVESHISVKGSLLGETLDNSIDGANLKHLITVPSGCGEQNMMGMTQTVIAIHFLDTTSQWDRIGVERREEAIKNIKQGYIQQMVFRKSDNSYSAFTNRPSSTWLTAYVVKIFSMAYKLIYIEKDVLCGAVSWLISEQQLPNGAFKEDAPVIHGEMVGGSGNTEPDASLTAFVLIALVESETHCKDKVPDLKSSLDKSVVYLEERLKTLRKPYSICITSYALSLVGKLPNPNKLMSSSTDGTHWADYSSDLYMIEATSYGMLALLKINRFALAEPVSRYLAEQRFYGGGYGSTQATVMVFQAMSEFQRLVPEMNEIDMDVTLSLPGRANSFTWKINTGNAMLQRSEKTVLKDKIKVKAVGKGQGTLTLMSVYYAPLAEGTAPCKNFDINVTIKDAPKAKTPVGALKTMFINICMKFLGVTDSTMTILDLTLLTGFTPDTEDLNRLTNRVDRYISKFEMDTSRSERGSLIIYLDKVSRSETECLKFKIHQNFEVGILQPSMVTIYEYYTLGNRCTKFYHPTEEQGELKKICRGAECHCISERCNLKNAHKTALDSASRVAAACHHRVDYVYESTLDSIEKTGAYDTYTMTITRVVKLGTDDVKDGTKRQFFSHQSCRDSVKARVGRTYIIWGRSEDLWELKGQQSYVINGGTWFEMVPTKRECNTILMDECEEIYKFIDDMRLHGCST